MALKDPEVPDRLRIFGRRVKFARLQREMSQTAVAKQLGLHGTQVSLTERGLRNPSLTEIDEWSEILHRPVAWLLEEGDPFTSVQDPYLNDTSNVVSLRRDSGARSSIAESPGLYLVSG